MAPFTIRVDYGTGSDVYDAPTLEAAEDRISRAVAFHSGNGHACVVSVTQDCEPCGGSGTVRSTRQARWMPGKPCKAYKGAGGFPV
jgi:DnaJ-class molecular chaperone